MTSPVLSASAQERGAGALKFSTAIADKPIRVVFLAPAETLEEARARVHHADLTQRRELAASVARRIGEAPDVSEVWLVSDEPNLLVAVVVPEMALERELEIRAQFAELTYRHDAELRIYAEADGRADLGRKGERLLG